MSARLKAFALYINVKKISRKAAEPQRGWLSIVFFNSLEKYLSQKFFQIVVSSIAHLPGTKLKLTRKGCVYEDLYFTLLVLDEPRCQ